MRIVHQDLPDQQISDLVSAITVHDQVSPVNELGELVLSGQRAAHCLIAIPDTDPSDSAPPLSYGFALIDPRANTVQLGVHPTYRRRGIATLLATAVSGYSTAHYWWAFGDLAGSSALAQKMGLVRQRELLIMSRPLSAFTPTPPSNGITITSYQPADGPQLVAVNAAAFAHHPEQGQLSISDFNLLTAQPWFDPNGLLVARRENQIVGFHWTKMHDQHTGEVYVLAVHPEEEGYGLGRSLLEAGLVYLSQQGMHEVILYVEASATRVVNLYKAATFKIINTDACYVKDAS